MKNKEQKLFKMLCKFNDDSFNRELLQEATPNVLGHLFFNRMQGIAYGMLEKNDCLGSVNREYRNSLYGAFEQNREKNHSYLFAVKYISELLKQCGCPVAMLKGAVLCNLYPDGYRTSNDIDLLIMPHDATEIGKCLTSNGFKQGYVKNGKFIPAARKEIIESKMMRGETVPYIKKIGCPWLEYLEIDLNFSLDYKSGDDAVLKAMIDNIVYRNIKGISIPTLCKEDFFIHLCSHLYKEATTMPWIQMGRDMSLYKYADIYMLLTQMTVVELAETFKRAKELEMEKICAFSVLQTSELFEISDHIVNIHANNLLHGDHSVLHEVYSPKEQKWYVYNTKNITKRFFMENRASDLTEVVNK